MKRIHELVQFISLVVSLKSEYNIIKNWHIQRDKWICSARIII